MNKMVVQSEIFSMNFNLTASNEDGYPLYMRKSGHNVKMIELVIHELFHKTYIYCGNRKHTLMLKSVVLWL